MSELARILRYVTSRCEIEQVADPCWIWDNRTRKTPVMSYGGKMVSVRRVIAHAQGRVALHGQYRRAIPSCENPLCVAPHHIDIVPPSVSIKRAMARTGAPARRGIKVAMAKQKTAKLTAEIVLAIRASSTPNAELAELYDVNISTIRDARYGRTWKYIGANPWAGLF